MGAPHEVLSPSEIKSIVAALGDTFGSVEGDVARAFGDVVGRIIINRVVGCRAYLGREKGWCVQPRHGDGLYCPQHIEEIEVWEQSMLEAKEQG